MPDPIDRTGLAAPARVAAARHGRWLRLAAGLALGALAAAVASRYPLAPGLMLVALLVYAAALWRWPVLWLAVVPATLGGCDLGVWTGWTMVEEPDLVVLVTLAVLLVRAPPTRADLRPRGLSGAAVALVGAALVVGLAEGLSRADLSAASAIAELSPLNPLRVAKGLAEALVLLPFLRGAFRTRPEARWMLAAGMAAGLALVSAATMVERVLFTGPFDFRMPYRVVGTFASMHFGGGYIGAFVAMALPFLLVPPPRARIAAVGSFILVAVGGLYTLVVTFARAAYVSATAAMLVAAALESCAAFRRGGRASALAVPLGLLLAVGAVVAVSAENARFMERRLDHLHRDFAARLDEWRAGLRLRDPGLTTTLFGMGLGRYARTALARHPEGRFPTDVALEHADGHAFLRVRAGLPLYLGQKVSVRPHALYRIRATIRTRDHGVLVVILCEKLLLYSGNCSAIDLMPEATGAWEQIDGVLQTGTLGERKVHGLTRPVELSLLVPEPGSSLDIAQVSFAEPDGREALVNGDFARGLDRWLPSDDNHTIWRIENQYLTTLFEEGASGVAALLLFAAAALWQGLRAAARGDRAAPALVAAISATLLSSLFDCPLEVPRLAALFYLIGFAALTLGEAAQPLRLGRARPPVADHVAAR